MKLKKGRTCCSTTTLRKNQIKPRKFHRKIAFYGNTEISSGQNLISSHSNRKEIHWSGCPGLKGSSQTSSHLWQLSKSRWVTLCPKDGCWPRSHLLPACHRGSQLECRSLLAFLLPVAWGAGALSGGSAFYPTKSMPDNSPVTQLGQQWHSPSQCGHVGLCPMVRSKDEPIPEHAGSGLRHRQVVPEVCLHSFKLQAMKKKVLPPTGNSSALQ